MSLSQHDAKHVFERLRSGEVPERGMDAFAVGIDRQRNEMQRLLGLAKQGEGLFKFLRGGYGCGKTFMSKLTLLEARREGFVTSFISIGDDLHLHKFGDIYRALISNLATRTCPRGALGDILDQWVGQVEDGLIAGGADEMADDFDEKVSQRLASELDSMVGGSAPDELIRVVQAIFEAKQEGEFAEAGALLSWMSGSQNVAHSAKKRAQVTKTVADSDPLQFLRGIVGIVKAAGYSGLVFAIDEVETILRTQRNIRAKSLNGIRQLCDAASSFSNMLWIFTGTPDFFDSKRGVRGLPPLYDRIKFIEVKGFASSKQPQLELKPFDEDRLREVALKLRELFPTDKRARVEQKIDDTFIERLVATVTEGFGGDVGMVPRQFLREFVNQIDLVEEYPEYNPQDALGDTPIELSEEERVQLETQDIDEEDDELVAEEDVW